MEIRTGGSSPSEIPKRPEYRARRIQASISNDVWACSFDAGISNVKSRGEKTMRRRFVFRVGIADVRVLYVSDSVTVPVSCIRRVRRSLKFDRAGLVH